MLKKKSDDGREGHPEFEILLKHFMFYLFNVIWNVTIPSLPKGYNHGNKQVLVSLIDKNKGV